MKKHAISTDEGLNEALKEEVQGIRGAMLGAANKHELPERFSVTAHPDEPRMFIHDLETMRVTSVPLFAYGETRRVLAELFGEAE